MKKQKAPGPLQAAITNTVAPEHVVEANPFEELLKKEVKLQSHATDEVTELRAKVKSLEEKFASLESTMKDRTNWIRDQLEQIMRQGPPGPSGGRSVCAVCGRPGCPHPERVSEQEFRMCGPRRVTRDYMMDPTKPFNYYCH